MPDTVDLYLRKSNKDERRSVERQLADLTRDAEADGLTVGRVFVDPDLSASRFARKSRPDYDALLAHISSGACHVIGIAEASRGSRALTEWSALLDLCRKRGVRVWVQTHQRIYDLARRRDWRALADEGLDAADESEKISERVLSGKRQAAAKGRPAGRPQFGYAREYDSAGHLVAVIPHPTEAPVVIEMIKRVADGDTLRAIADDFNGRGITTPGGRSWRGTFIRQLVLRPAYNGRRVHQGQDVGEAMWPALVDPALWRRAVTVLTRPERRSTTRGVELRHWLANTALCGACRSSRLAHNAGGTKGAAKYFCVCGKVFVSADALEKTVAAVIQARLDGVDARQAFTPEPDNGELAGITEHLADLRAQLDQNAADYRAGIISARLAGAREAELETQIEAAEVRVRRLSLPPELAELAEVDVAKEWADFPPAKKRAVVRHLADLVVAPALRRGPRFDPARLDASRWRGDARTWGGLPATPA